MLNLALSQSHSAKASKVGIPVSPNSNTNHNLLVYYANSEEQQGGEMFVGIQDSEYGNED